MSKKVYVLIRRHYDWHSFDDVIKASTIKQKLIDHHASIKENAPLETYVNNTCRSDGSGSNHYYIEEFDD